MNSNQTQMSEGKALRFGRISFETILVPERIVILHKIEFDVK